MATLYLRNVPDDVMDRLQRLAARQAISVNVAAVRELAESTRWVDNEALFADLPDLDVSTEAIVEALDRGRAER